MDAQPREPYQAPALPQLISTVDTAQNQIQSFGGADGGVYASIVG